MLLRDYWLFSERAHCFPIAALCMMFPPILSEFYTLLKVISGGLFLKLLDWMWCFLLSQPHSTLHLMHSVFCVHIYIFFIQQYKLLEVDSLSYTVGALNKSCWIEVNSKWAVRFIFKNKWTNIAIIYFKCGITKITMKRRTNFHYNLEINEM